MIDAFVRLPWRLGTVTCLRPEGRGIVTIGLDVPGWPGHLPGQHIDLRLTSSEGYHAQRSYSIASVSGAPTVDITVECVLGGEISPFLNNGLALGDVIEVKGPIGHYFTWRPGLSESLRLIAGGSGIVPLMAILREREKAGDRTPTHLLYSARTVDGLIYRQELDALAINGDGLQITFALTREQPTNWGGERRRVDRAMLEATGMRPGASGLAFVCGPTAMVEQVATHLVDLGYSPESVITERFGPSGKL